MKRCAPARSFLSSEPQRAAKPEPLHIVVVLRDEYKHGRNFDRVWNNLLACDMQIDVADDHVGRIAGQWDHGDFSMLLDVTGVQTVYLDSDRRAVKREAFVLKPGKALRRVS